MGFFPTPNYTTKNLTFSEVWETLEGKKRIECEKILGRYNISRELETITSRWWLIRLKEPKTSTLERLEIPEDCVIHYNVIKNYVIINLTRFKAHQKIRLRVMGEITPLEFYQYMRRLLDVKGLGRKSTVEIIKGNLKGVKGIIVWETKTHVGILLRGEKINPRTGETKKVSKFGDRIVKIPKTNIRKIETEKVKPKNQGVKVKFKGVEIEIPLSLHRKILLCHESVKRRPNDITITYEIRGQILKFTKTYTLIGLSKMCKNCEWRELCEVINS